MIYVTVPTKDGVEVQEFDTHLCEIIDGWLVIQERGSELGQVVTVAGFAPGAAVGFEMGAPDG